jgi:CarD family transcriptional regulator
MYQIGDKVFYPMHGAGLIEAIEEKEVLGEKHMYYVMNLALGNINIMFPIEKALDLGIRQVVDVDIMENVLTYFHDGETDSSMNSNQRYRANTSKMRSGDIYEGAQVIRDLVRIGQKKTLGTGDKLMLNNARQILISELVQVKELEQDKAAELLNQVINN